MANHVIGARNWLRPETGTYSARTSGGLWATDLPFENALDPSRAIVARSLDTNPQHTRRWLDFGTPRDTRVLAFVAPVASRDAKFRARCFESFGDESSEVLGDSGWLELYPEIYPPGSLPSWHVSFTDGRLPEEEARLYPTHLYHVFDVAVVGRYWLIEIDDRGSKLGYVDLPHVMLTPGWQSSVDMSLGASIQYEDRSIREETPSGAEYYEVLPGRRVVRFEVDYMSEDEAMTWAFDLMQQQGTHAEVFFIWDPDDVAHRHRRSFYGRLRSLKAVEAMSFGLFGTAFEIAEIL